MSNGFWHDEKKILAKPEMDFYFTTSSTIKIENRSEKISKKPKISVCTLFSNLDNILKVLMYPLGAFSIMTSFLFEISLVNSYIVKKVKFQIHL